MVQQKRGTSSLQEMGFKDWKNIGAILSSHEKNTDHLENYQAWCELELCFLKEKQLMILTCRKLGKKNNIGNKSWNA